MGGMVHTEDRTMTATPRDHLIVGVTCLLCSSAVPGVWSFLRVTPRNQCNTGIMTQWYSSTVTATPNPQHDMAVHVRHGLSTCWKSPMWYINSWTQLITDPACGTANLSTQAGCAVHGPAPAGAQDQPLPFHNALPLAVTFCGTFRQWCGAM